MDSDHDVAVMLKASLPACARLERVLLIAQEHAAYHGDWRGCVAAWLDRATVYLDHRREDDGTCRKVVVDWSAAQLDRFDTTAARLLVDGLERLDARWPRRVEPAAFLAGVAQVHLRTGSSGGMVDPPLRHRLAAWRFGFDLDRMQLASIDDFVCALPAMPPSALAWPQRDDDWQRFFASGCRRWSSVASWLDIMRDAERELCSELARIRLLRLALAFQLGEPLPALADPFAERPLQIEVFADRARFRSAATHEALQRVAYRR